MEVGTKHLGGSQFEVTARGHRVFCDQPQSQGGYDEGMTPPEFLLASLGACAGYYAVQYLQARKLPTEGLYIRTTAGKAKNPARMEDFHIEVECPGILDEQTRQGVLAAVHKCLVHNTLMHAPRIQVDVVSLAAAA